MSDAKTEAIFAQRNLIAMGLDIEKPEITSSLQRLQTTLERLDKRDQRRHLAQRVGHDFSSNDYLGLSRHPKMIEALQEALTEGTAIGAGGSRLLRGNCPEHEALEEKAARFFGAKRTLFFGAGYMANHALLTTLPRQGDLVVYDELIHASSHDGMRGARAEARAARHNDANDAEAIIKEWRKAGNKGQVWLALESLYSMDGDRADLAAFDALAKEHDGILLIDEAHATGVFGPDGRGFAAELEGEDHIVTIHTCGKALGAQGALVCASRTICDYLINRCRPFIYATAPSPLIAVAVSTALDLVEHEPERRLRLHQLIAHLGDHLSRLEEFQASGTQIQPIILGNNARTMAIADRMQLQGYDIRGIRPPTVPEGTARLRIALNVESNETILDGMIEQLQEALAMEAER